MQENKTCRGYEDSDIPTFLWFTGHKASSTFLDWSRLVGFSGPAGSVSCIPAGPFVGAIDTSDYPNPRTVVPQGSSSLRWCASVIELPPTRLDDWVDNTDGTMKNVPLARYRRVSTSCTSSAWWRWHYVARQRWQCVIGGIVYMIAQISCWRILFWHARHWSTRKRTSSPCQSSKTHGTLSSSQVHDVRNPSSFLLSTCAIQVRSYCRVFPHLIDTIDAQGSLSTLIGWFDYRNQAF